MSRQTMMSPLPAGQSDRDWRRLFTLENRFIPPIFITLILLVGNLSFGILESYTKTLLAIGCQHCCRTDSWPHSLSANGHISPAPISLASASAFFSVHPHFGLTRCALSSPLPRSMWFA